MPAAPDAVQIAELLLWSKSYNRASDLEHNARGRRGPGKGYVTSCGLASEKFEGLSWESFMLSRSVDYRGEEVRLARTFRWENIEPGLPDCIGSTPLSEVCELGTL